MGVVIAAKAFRPTRGQDFRIRKTATRDPAGCKVRGIASRPTTEGNGATRRAREAVPTPPRTFTCCGCGGDLNYNGHCNPEIDALIDQQSTETNQEKRKRLVSEIERKLAEDGERPIIFHNRGVSCWQPYVKVLAIMVNSITNGWRMKDVWLDK